MPQLDFFIFSHIVIQATMIFFFLLLIVYNDFLVKIFKSLKTRKLFLDILSESPAVEESKNLSTETTTNLLQLDKLLQIQKNSIKQDVNI